MSVSQSDSGTADGVDTSWVESEFGTTNANVLLALKGLEADGLLVSYQLTKRVRAWRSQEILLCLDASRREWDVAAASDHRGWKEFAVAAHLPYLKDAAFIGGNLAHRVALLAA